MTTPIISLTHGDCLDVLKNILTESIDMIFADVPYGTTQAKWDSVIDLPLMWVQCKRVIKLRGAMVFTAQCPFDKVLGVSNLEMLRYEWIWEKTSSTGHFNAKKMPMKAHENVLVFYKKLPTYNPQMTHGHVRKTALKRKKNNSEIYNPNTSDNFYDSTSRYPRSVLIFPSDKQTSSLISTQKPVALSDYFIKTYTNPGEVVLDFAMGSGTTGVSCKKLGRNFIGIEKKEKTYNIAKERLNVS